MHVEWNPKITEMQESTPQQQRQKENIHVQFKSLWEFGTLQKIYKAVS